MAVHIKCTRPYNIEALKAIMERCGGRGPSPPRCPPMNQTPNNPFIPYSATSSSPEHRLIPCSPPASSSPRKSCAPLSVPVPCMTCPPMAPIPSCPPSPFIRPPCTGYPCVTCAPFPKPVPAPYEPPRPIIRTPMNSGGLFYTGTTVCYACPPPVSSPRCLPYTPIPGMSVSC